MKKIFLLLIAFSLARFAQAQQNLAGTWAGKLTVPSGSLRLIIHVTKTGETYMATLDSPDQGARGIPFSRANVSGDSVLFELDMARANYSGVITSDSTISGRWTQGMSLPLDLKKVPEGQTEAKVNRPQTPKPPFPYNSKDVMYSNSDSSIQFGATITSPQGNGPFPAVLLITGSGPQNRDEELFGHKPFAVIADALTRKGFLVLRVDDRGVGQTTGDFSTATSRDFADDAVAGLNYLLSLPEVDKSRVGLLGHSEGGMIAEMVAAERKDLNFVILLAAPGIKIIDLMADQNQAVLQSNGATKEMAGAYAALYKPLAVLLANANDESTAKKAAQEVVDAWIKQTPKETVVATTGIR
ncbi:MAG TPA: alpha/beta fold hydrolase, partial [Flavisolibacter sp.]|nr:alpha/beta fold hydrolase [Flavisolibacter sp.]